jgi:signal transduction histidine kinase
MKEASMMRDVPPDPDLPELVAMLAHDLKNPLAALMTNLHFVVSGGGIEAEANEALADALALSDVLERILNNLDLLALQARDERAPPPAAPSSRLPISIRRAARDLVHRAARQATSVSVEIVLVEPGEDVLALVEAESFVRASENVLQNALDNAPRGTEVRVAVERVGAEASLSVLDQRLHPSILFDPDASPPPSLRRFQHLYGRGLSLLCARIAAAAAGARLELTGKPKACRMRLVAPARA